MNSGKRYCSALLLSAVIAFSALLFASCTDRTSPPASGTDVSAENPASNSDHPVETGADTQGGIFGTGIASDETVDITDHETEEKEMMKTLKMNIGGAPVDVEWEENESVAALTELVKDKPLTVQTSMYGGFEQVGSIGTSLPRNDVRITTQPGDIVLYSGDQIVVFYGSNSWAYTRLGRITGKNTAQLKELLGSGDTVITIELQ